MEFELLQKVVVAVLNVDPSEISEDTTFVEDLGADSLDLFQIFMGVLEDLHLDDEELVNKENLGKVRTMKDAVALVQNIKK